MQTTSPASHVLGALAVSPGYASLGPDFVEFRDPTALPEPSLAAFNPEVAALLGLPEAAATDPDFLRIAAGNARFGAVPSFASVYAGHQFGVWVPQLGDGRAITLGEVEGPGGDRWEWQLKGAGPTAFSRFADGRAVLRSTIREYLCSEAMHALGIPTTRALAIAVSPQPVYRERVETAAVLSRVAPTHLRFGTFQYFAQTERPEHLKRLADYTIERFFPALGSLPNEERYAAFLGEVVGRTARLIAAWQAVGFQHGVMNTDNMSILGLTLDYGPFGFMEAYAPAWVCNHSDEGGRYRFEMQPTIGLWNLRRLADALGSLVAEDASRDVLQTYEATYRAAFLARLRAKLGLATERADDVDTLVSLLTLLEAGRVDYTIFFRSLSSLTRESTPADDAVAALFADRDAWYAWQRRYRERLADEAADDATRLAAMRAVNPKIVLRNYLAQQAIDAAERGTFDELHALGAALRTPFAEGPEADRFAGPAPDWARTLQVSCSS